MVKKIPTENTESKTLIAYNFPEHNVSFLASSMDEALALLDEHLNLKS